MTARDEELTRLADAVSGFLETPRLAAAEALTAAAVPGLPAGDFDRIRLADRVLQRLTATLDAHSWHLFGPRRIRSLAGALERACPARGTFLELGCGRENPRALSTLLYLNGVDGCLACDVDPCTDPSRAALAIYDLLLQCLAYPDRFRFPGASARTFAERLARFDLARLRDGQDGFGDVPCRHVVGDLRAAWQAAGSPEVTLLYSSSVLEHPSDLEGLAAALAAVVVPGGRMVHEVDFRDHRSYASELSPWAYLLEGTAPQDIVNELRFSEMVALVERHGFRLESARRLDEIPPDDHWERLRPRFRAMPREDILTQHATLVFERL